jgi:hypothetical protein
VSGVRAERDQQDVPRVDRANEKSAGDRTAGALVVAQRAIGNRAVLALMRRSAPPGRRVLARRRIPSQAELEQILLDPSGAGTVEAADVAEHRAGLRRLIEMSRHEMTAQQRARVNVKRQEGLTAVQWGALTDTQKAIREASAIIAVRPDTRLGDPLLIDTGPRPGTSDAAHVTQLVNSANAILDRIATGAVDGHIKQVFGAAKLADAKARYANARVRLNFLHTHDQIVTDRSGYNAEVSLGGLTNTDQISLAPHVIDHPTRRESIVTFIHESMHAGNADVGDEGGYIDREDEFKTAGEDEKLHNAAHFEVVPRRMLGMGHAGLAYPGVTFIPSAPPPPPVGAPPPPPPPVGGGGGPRRWDRRGRRSRRPWKLPTRPTRRRGPRA